MATLTPRLLCAQALGKQYNTEELVEQLGSTKPMADVWKSGIVRTEEGCVGCCAAASALGRQSALTHGRARRVDITAWRLMGAHAEGFRRLKAPVVFLRATSEDASLFNFVFEDEDGHTSYGACCLRCAGAACVL